MKKIAIAGATGFVGQALMKRLGAEVELIGLSRSRSDAPFRVCDFFSLRDAEEGVNGADVAIYLVHSMLPSSRLTQANFADLDLIAADNFARACAGAGVKQIIYLGGLLPEPGEKTSRHLQSRAEVEEVLKSHRVPVTAFRAGLILGEDGSSFLMLKRLVKRLPVMILPHWTKTISEAVDLEGVVDAMCFSILNEKCFNRDFDLSFDQPHSYEEMILLASEILNRRPIILPIRLITPGLSKLWVSLITGAPRSLVGPLVESLCHPIRAKNDDIYRLMNRPKCDFKKSLREAVLRPSTRDRLREMRQRKMKSSETNDVRSVQRMKMPSGMRAQEVSLEYLKWLQTSFWLFMRVESEGQNRILFRSIFLKPALLILEMDFSRSSIDRSLLRIKGGLLASPDGRGRLEFREVLGGQFVLAAIHDFRPKLPWIIYKFTQALAHLLVMKAFDRHLQRLQIRRL